MSNKYVTIMLHIDQPIPEESVDEIVNKYLDTLADVSENVGDLTWHSVEWQTSDVEN